MPTALAELPALLEPPRKRWTRAEIDALASTGLFDQERLELIEGELINKMGKKQPHVTSVGLLVEWLREVFGGRRVVQEGPIDVAPEDNPSNEPEPDLMVLNRDFTHFMPEKPRPQDLNLLVEVADSTIGFDLTTKAALYARAGIVEYWVLDIGGKRMVVHRDPREGRYASVVVYGYEESVAPMAAPGSMLRIRDAFPG